ncbi:hypothetical protein CAOG_05971 [Capsaspora owczarzaki ATCC 30864]|uniref:PXA domain-containing protein n=1 Tax=Capsaspora owczarzaki (strain ATCC 30864) TaxID=595528 RepID=A0A0D2X466_CAPO3|nr:hypothetical protein CAOG_05971 [Capsaspora owczarzaki ATCC 30864]KJE95524.1 hypothetical protein CAOG_005971 [Capsaspora owczarzaki ATCC 30864]|eukprot:XP_004345561.1 hypothetical protein CAOG_05971 [Capsaspora owczarzaki ATCC 30864]
MSLAGETTPTTTTTTTTTTTRSAATPDSAATAGAAAPAWKELVLQTYAALAGQPQPLQPGQPAAPATGRLTLAAAIAAVAFAILFAGMGPLRLLLFGSSLAVAAAGGYALACVSLRGRKPALKHLEPEQAERERLALNAAAQELLDGCDADVNDAPGSVLDISESVMSERSAATAPAALCRRSRQLSQVGDGLQSTPQLNLSVPLHAAISTLCDSLVANYVMGWYGYYIGDDDAFLSDLKTLIVSAFFKFRVYSPRFDLPMLTVYRFVHMFIVHLRQFRAAEESGMDVAAYFGPAGPGHPYLHFAVRSRDNELRYLRQVADVLILKLTPQRENQSQVFRHMFREIIAQHCLLPTVRYLADPDYINQMVLTMLLRQRLRPYDRVKLKVVQAKSILHTNVKGLLTCQIVLKTKAGEHSTPKTPPSSGSPTWNDEAIVPLASVQGDFHMTVSLYHCPNSNPSSNVLLGTQRIDLAKLPPGKASKHWHALNDPETGVQSGLLMLELTLLLREDLASTASSTPATVTDDATGHAPNNEAAMSSATAATPSPVAAAAAAAPAAAKPVPPPRPPRPAALVAAARAAPTSASDSPATQTSTSSTDTQSTDTTQSTDVTQSTDTLISDAANEASLQWMVKQQPHAYVDANVTAAQLARLSVPESTMILQASPTLTPVQAAVQMTRLLRSNAAFGCLMDYLTSVNAKALLQFWIDADQFRQVTAAAAGVHTISTPVVKAEMCRQEARHIVQQHLKPDSPSHIHVSSRALAIVLSALEDSTVTPGLELFRPIESEVFARLCEHLPGFLASSFYANFIGEASFPAAATGNSTSGTIPSSASQTSVADIASSVSSAATEAVVETPVSTSADGAPTSLAHTPGAPPSTASSEAHIEAPAVAAPADGDSIIPTTGLPPIALPVVVQPVTLTPKEHDDTPDVDLDDDERLNRDITRTKQHDGTKSHKQAPAVPPRPAPSVLAHRQSQAASHGVSLVIPAAVHYAQVKSTGADAHHEETSTTRRLLSKLGVRDDAASTGTAGASGPGSTSTTAGITEPQEGGVKEAIATFGNLIDRLRSKSRSDGAPELDLPRASSGGDKAYKAHIIETQLDSKQRIQYVVTVQPLAPAPAAAAAAAAGNDNTATGGHDAVTLAPLASTNDPSTLGAPDTAHSSSENAQYPLPAVRETGWVIVRSFRDFSTLHTALQKLQKVRNIDFPSSTLERTNHAAARVQLDTFLQQLLADPQASQTEAVANFLNMGEVVSHAGASHGASPAQIDADSDSVLDRVSAKFRLIKEKLVDDKDPKDGPKKVSGKLFSSFLHGSDEDIQAAEATASVHPTVPASAEAAPTRLASVDSDLAASPLDSLHGATASRNSPDASGIPSRARSTPEPQAAPSDSSSVAAASTTTDDNEDVFSESELSFISGEDGDLLIETGFALMDELFMLKDEDKWLRRQAVSVLKQVLLQMHGETINRRIIESMHAMTNEKQWAVFFERLNRDMAPLSAAAGTSSVTALSRSSSVRSEDDKARTRADAQAELLACIPEALQHVVGRSNAISGVTRAFDMLQHDILTKHLLYTMLDATLVALFTPDS